MIIEASELTKFFPSSVDAEALTTLSVEIESITTNWVDILRRRETERAEFDQMKKAKTAIIKSISSLRNAKDGFDTITYTTLVENSVQDNEIERLELSFYNASAAQKQGILLKIDALNTHTFGTAANSILRHMPNKKPSSIKKKVVEKVLSILRLSCDRIHPNMAWYSYSDYSRQYSGEFFELCSMVVKRMGIVVSDSTLHSYLKTTVKPDRDKNLAAEIELKAAGLPHIALGRNPSELLEMYKGVKIDKKKQ